jgi:hypothetical protein
MTNEEEKTKEGDPVLGKFNLALLHYTGYDDTQITALGDLSQLPEAKMQELIQASPEAKIKAAVDDYEKSGLKFGFLDNKNRSKNGD